MPEITASSRNEDGALGKWEAETRLRPWFLVYPHLTVGTNRDNSARQETKALSMPRKQPPTSEQDRSGQEGGAIGQSGHGDRVTSKRALAEALQLLGPEATSRDIGRFMKKHFGIEHTFVLIAPKKTSQKKLPKASRPKAA